MTEGITVEPAPRAAMQVVAAMVGDYLDALGVAVPIARASVLLYWDEVGRWPSLIRVRGVIAGFALVRGLAPGSFELAEFSVLPAYRRQGVGRAAAAAVFARFPRHWRLRAVPGAGQFWDGTFAGAGWQSVVEDSGWRSFNVVQGGGSDGRTG